MPAELHHFTRLTNEKGIVDKQGKEKGKHIKLLIQNKRMDAYQLE